MEGVVSELLALERGTEQQQMDALQAQFVQLRAEYEQKNMEWTDQMKVNVCCRTFYWVVTVFVVRGDSICAWN